METGGIVSKENIESIATVHEGGEWVQCNRCMGLFEKMSEDWDCHHCIKLSDKEANDKKVAHEKAMKRAYEWLCNLVEVKCN